MKNALNVLLIEDNMMEIMKMNRVFSLLDVKHKIAAAKNTEEALAILETKENLPDIILLDLNIPNVNGIEFLSILKKDADLHHIPTIILATSDNRKDILDYYDIGISGYILKPLTYEEYVSKIEIALSYWSINELKSA